MTEPTTTLRQGIIAELGREDRPATTWHIKRTLRVPTKVARRELDAMLRDGLVERHRFSGPNVTYWVLAGSDQQ